MLKVNDEVEEVLVRVISIACPILSILGYFTGISVVKEIRQKGCTRRFRFLPNLTGIIYCLVWFYYGLLKLDWTVMFSNTIGSSMQCFYMMVFIQYSKPPPLLQISLGWMTLFVGWIHLNLVVGSREGVLARLGFVGALSNILNNMACLIEFFSTIELHKEKAKQTKKFNNISQPKQFNSQEFYSSLVSYFQENIFCTSRKKQSKIYKKGPPRDSPMERKASKPIVIDISLNPGVILKNSFLTLLDIHIYYLSLLWQKFVAVLPFLNSITWSTYGYLIDDIYIVTPYGFGLLCEVIKIFYRTCCM